MKIAIIGYGKMGRMIESIATEKGHTIGSRIDIDNQDLLAAEELRKHDVAIEFSVPGTAYGNISKCLDAGLPVVSGTTGWTDRLPELIERCREENGSFLYASNFSLGVNILFHLNRRLASIMNRHQQYDPMISEIHHIQKLDAPSGTALTLAEGILAEIERKKEWELLDPEKPAAAQSGASDDPLTGSYSGSGSFDDRPAGSVTNSGQDTGKLWIKAIRAGTVAGVHEVHYESDFDSLSIRHSAKDRRGFAQGAVLAAEFIRDKKGYFTMKEVLEL